MGTTLLILVSKQSELSSFTPEQIVGGSVFCDMERVLFVKTTGFMEAVRTYTEFNGWSVTCIRNYRPTPSYYGGNAGSIA